MSSHHIIREHQEPALYVHDWHPHYTEVFGQLCEWSPKIYTNAKTDVILKDMGYKVDACLLGDNDFLERVNSLRSQIEHINVLTERVELIAEIKQEAVVFLNDKQRGFYRSSGHSKWYAEKFPFSVKGVGDSWKEFVGEGKIVAFEGACWVREEY